MIPSTSFYRNLRSILPKERWDRIRKKVYQKARYACEVCGGKGSKWPIECHEIWEYNESKHIQKLAGLIALCPNCHSVQHMGLTTLNGRADEAEAHLKKVNGWTDKQVRKHVDEAWKIWKDRSSHEWELDISWLELV